MGVKAHGPSCYVVCVRCTGLRRWALGAPPTRAGYVSIGARDCAVIKVRVRLVGESVRPARAPLIHGAVVAARLLSHPPNVCSVVVCPHSAAERRQHAVRHGTCGLPLTQPVTQRCALVRSHYPQPSLCEAARPMRTPVQARCERFVLLPAGQPCEPIPSPQRPVLRRRVVVLPSAPVRVVATLRPNNGRVAKALRAARPVRICHLHCLVARVAVGKDQRGQQD